ncbi:MAG: prepilin-type N-terminal cleavage/methylation domain-containing protein [bacterium]|nr:prepilin-type N-terminal cleavage/methylation domain-containing protein [bacterium]
MNPLKEKINKNKSGFTLVETLVAISILVLAVTGAFSAAQSGLSSYNHSKNQTIAIYLAQEAIEQIRYRRSTNTISGSYWLSSVAEASSNVCFDTLNNGKSCTVDVLNNTLTACSGTCPVIRQNTDGDNSYGYTGAWTATIFRRSVQITPVYPAGCINNCSEVSVLVTITWSKGLVNRQFKIRENLFDWQ